MSRLRQAALIGALVCAGSCRLERVSPSTEQTGAKPRAESAAISLPSDPRALAALLAVSPDSLRAAGLERYDRQEFDSARAIWRIEIARARESGDSAGVAFARMWLGLAAYKLGDYAAARREGEGALEMKRRLGLDAELSRSFNALGLLAWNEGKHREALQLFDSALASARRHGDLAGAGRAAANIPLVQIELGDFDGARRGLVEALAVGRKLDDHRLAGNALANLAMLDIRLGNPVAALPLLADARREYSTIDYSVGEANALGQLATAWSELGNIQSAIAAADSALAIARSAGIKQEIAAELEVIADLQVQAGNPRLALRRLLEADSLNATVGLTVERGTDLRRVAAILLELDEAAASVARAREALASHRGTEARAEMVYDRLQLAQSVARTKDIAFATVQVDSAVHEAALMKNPAAMRDAAAVVARLALDAHNPARALATLDRVANPRGVTDWQLADLRAEALLSLGHLDAARAEGERALSMLERERSSLGEGPLRSGYLASRAAPFSHLVAIHLARADTASAFHVAASLPGRSLAERLGGFVVAPKSVAAIADGEKLLLRIAALEQGISDAGTDQQLAERRRSLESELEAARAAYETHLSSRAVSPDSRLLGLASVSLAETQAELADGEALLAFLSGPASIDAFLVRKSSVLHYTVLVGERALAQRVRLALWLLGRGAPASPVPSALGELYDLLIGPADRSGALRGVRSVVIVPHGPLGALPFAALWDRSSGKFLVEERIVRYLPSVAALKGGAAQTRIPDREAIFAPLPDSLPGTATEAHAIAKLVTGADLRMGAASTESGVRAALAAGRSVHIASHGSHNSQNPLFSRMIVGSSRSANSDDDGRLEVHEILGLPVRSPLVFLSGCETGLGSGGDGPFARGSEEGSLAQAFLIAGARAVVATLWRVDDKGAVRVVESFYKYLRAGRPPEEALAVAQRDAINARSGYTWGAYVMSGTRARKSATMVRTNRGTANSQSVSVEHLLDNRPGRTH